MIKLMGRGRKLLFLLGLGALFLGTYSMALAVTPKEEGSVESGIGGGIGGTSDPGSNPGQSSCVWALSKCLTSGSCSNGYTPAVKCEGKIEGDCKNNASPQDCVKVSGGSSDKTGGSSDTAGSSDTKGGVFSIQNPLRFGTLSDVLNAIGGFLFDISIPIVTVMVLFGGFQILTAAGNAQQVDAGKKTLLYAVVGFVIILLAGGIAQLIGSIIGGGSSGTQQQQQQQCPQGFTGTPPNCNPPRGI